MLDVPRPFTGRESLAVPEYSVTISDTSFTLPTLFLLCVEGRVFRNTCIINCADVRRPP